MLSDILPASSSLKFLCFLMAIKIPKIKKRKSWQSKLGDLAMGLAALAIVAFLAVSNWRIHNSRQDLSGKVKELREQVQILEERRETLKAGLSAAQGENFQEERMREQGYKKPGEEVIAILQDGQTSATKQGDGISGDNFWTDLWQKIKGIN